MGARPASGQGHPGDGTRGVHLGDQSLTHAEFAKGRVDGRRWNHDTASGIVDALPAVIDTAGDGESEGVHGPFGEDGTIQGLFEMMGIRYVGSGVAASANGMDKDLMKTALAGAGLPVAPWVTIHQRQWGTEQAHFLRKIEADLTFPVFVKPARGGSSLGISRAASPDDLVRCIEEAFEFDPKVIVEQGLVGAREVEVAVLDNLDGPPRVSLAGEIRMHGGEGAFYDFEAKYTPGEQVSLDVPAAIDGPLLARLQRLGAKTFRALGAEGLSRVDMFVTPDEDVFVNELNTMPGFTYISMYPQLWEATGLSYADLIAELIRLALERPTGLR